MRKQVLFTLTVLVLVTLACSLVNGLGSGDSGDSGDSESVPPPAPATEAQAVPQDTGAGPETINLSNPAMYANDAYPAYKMNTSIKYDGVDTTGSPKTFELVFNIANQLEPRAQHISMAGGDDSTENIEFIVLGDQAMSIFPGVGCTIFPAESMQDQSPEESFPDMNGLLTGQAKRVETGINIEGVVTDRYELTSENMADPDNSETPKINDGSVYVAQDGNYIVRIEMNGTVNTAENGFDPNTEAQVSLNYTFIPVEDGSLNIVPPTECADQLAGSSDYPVMDGASGLISMEDTVFYTVEASLDEVLDFYRTTMPEDGWEMAKDVGGSNISFATLEFTKDGESVEVNAITTGDSVSVTVTKK